MSNVTSTEFRDFIRALLNAQIVVLKHGDIATGMYGQSSARWRVMLRVSSGDTTVSTIAKESGFSRQAVQRLADNLVSDGLVVYSDSKTDKRTQTISFTSEGMMLFEKMEHSFDSWSERLMSEISREKLSLLTEQLDAVRLIVDDDISNFKKEDGSE